MNNDERLIRSTAAKTAVFDDDDSFLGHQPRACGEHRTVGTHRAWCHTDREWCYPSDPCAGCSAEFDVGAVESALTDAIENWMLVPTGETQYAHGKAQGIAHALAAGRSTSFVAEWEAGLDRYQNRVTGQ